MSDSVLSSGSSKVSKPANKKPVKSVAKRKFHTKSRSGCNTCKRRRVKCDEAKPICAKCVHMKLECTYANIALAKASQKSINKSSKLGVKSSPQDSSANDDPSAQSSSTSSSPFTSTASIPQSQLSSIGLNKLQNSSVTSSPLMNMLPSYNGTSSIASTNAAIQLLLANATNTLSASNNTVKNLLSGSSDISAGISTFLSKGVKQEDTGIAIEQFVSSTVAGANATPPVSTVQSHTIIDDRSSNSKNSRNQKQQQQQQQQQQVPPLPQTPQNKGNILSSILSILGNSSSQQNTNPLGTILSSFLANNMEVPTASSLLNLANSNELYPGLNTLASRVQDTRRDSASSQGKPCIVSDSAKSDLSVSDNNNDTHTRQKNISSNLGTNGVHLPSDMPFISSAKASSTIAIAMDGTDNDNDNVDQSHSAANASSVSSAAAAAAAATAAAAASSSPPKSPSYDNPELSPKLHMLDLKLMYHYTSKVWPTITAAGISEEKLWSEYVPQLAFDYPFLMHSVLAFSATHLSRTEDGLDEYVYYHRGEALKLLRDAVLEISLENTDALVASAIILIMDALANASLPSLTSSASPKSLPASAWIYHVKGAATILTAVWPLNKASRFHKFISVDLSDLGDIMNNGPESLNVTGTSSPLRNNKFYSDLKCFDPSIADLYPVEYTSPYLVTLAYLDKLYNERYKSDFILRIFSFPALLDKTFLALLMTGDLAAMRIMRCYYTMLRSFTSEWKDKVWFLEGVCKVLPADVDDYSGGGGMHMMLDFLGGGLPSLSTVVGSGGAAGTGNFEIDSSGFMN